MLRQIHRWPGLLAAVLILALALSGAALSLFPALERLSSPSEVSGQTVGDLATKVLAVHPQVEQIRRSPSGTITAYWFDGDLAGAAVVDPATGLDVASADQGALRRWLTDFHRSLLFGDPGRFGSAVGALAMLMLAASGAMLVARRQGGWGRWFAAVKGPWSGRWHAELARVAVFGLGLSALTALWMTAATFDLLPADEANPVMPHAVSGVTGLAPNAMPALQKVLVADLRDLTFPYPGDTTDVFTLSTGSGTGYIDQGTGEMLAWQAPGPWTVVGEWIYVIHTGDGAALWGLLLGLAALTVPVLSVTGGLIWWRNRQSRPRLAGMVAAPVAETVILVGSEGGSTWGFATALACALQAHGQAVHVAALSAFAPRTYKHAKRIVVMTATWGDGDAPTSAKGALDRLATAAPLSGVPLVVLGFGDRSFPGFCAYAEAVQAAAKAAGWAMQMPLDRIDRQSPQAFARWSRAFGEWIGFSLDITHQPLPPQSTALRLMSRKDYGDSVQAPTAILRFAVPKGGLWQRLTGRGFGRFRAGDLLGVVPQGDTVPRFYSLASSQADGFVEIVVRKHVGGLCSGQLLALQPGDAVQAFLRPNPGFQPDRSQAPLILIGAGTGIGPLAGFLRANWKHRPMHLWFGARHPQADFLYADDLANWQRDRRLTGLRTAFSRMGKRHYVQDALREDAEAIRRMIAEGARVMVCGGREMAQGVREAMTEILHPLGLSPVTLQAGGRYAEDIY
ncbi:PepSY domain-containing protein [Tabrizicola sp. J26]|uniref:PepSY domain-containing protein n=1 Tax=Alitabrizicola rongguiensis TaxID=2909234 RepID=UPI001F255B08|nr:PepSY domain-containing protein [Tabrizicola rongguiensis]MCF1708895.1 PepSY domain-containing protein [Tabrizicola rongguiensis]